MQLKPKPSGAFFMQTCPHCSIEIRIRELPYQGFFKSFRICPDCGGCFTVDADTKHRQTILLFILIVTLLIMMLLYFLGSEWWKIPSIFCFVIVGLFTCWANKRVFLVSCREDQKKSSNT